MGAANQSFRIYRLSEFRLNLLFLLPFRDAIAHIRVGLNIV
jgi:hypothetical protein